MSRRFGRSINRLSLLVLALCFVLIGIDRASTQAAQISLWRPVTLTLYEWAILLSAFALLAGGFNIVWTHFRRIQQGGTDWVLSLILLVVLTTVLTAGLLERSGTAGFMLEWIFENVIAPLQASLFAILGLFLAAAAYRYLRIGRPGGGWMVAGALAMFLIQMPFSQSLLNAITDNPAASTTSTAVGSIEVGIRWLLEWPVMGVMRGAILGSALSLLVLALRFLLGYRT